MRGEGGSFYSPRRSVPARNKYGNTRHCLQEDRINFPAKDETEAADMGPADPVVQPAHECRLSRRLSSWTLPGGPPTCVCRCRALYVSFLCQMGLCWMCNAAAMFCVSLLCLLRVFMLFPTCVPANQESPKLVEMVSNKPYSYVW